MADITTLLEDLARGQDRLAQNVAALGQHVDRVVAGLAIVGEDIRAQREEIREHRKEAGDMRVLIGRVLDRLDRLVEDEIADLRRRVERLERY